MPECSRIDDLVTPFVDGELPPADQAVVTAHLAACRPCRARVAAEQAVHGLLAARRSFGMLFQNGALFDSMDVYHNIAFPLREHKRLGRAEERDLVLGRLAELNLVGVEHKFPAELSGGMKKRVALARACILDPEILKGHTFLSLNELEGEREVPSLQPTSWIGPTHYGYPFHSNLTTTRQLLRNEARSGAQIACVAVSQLRQLVTERQGIVGLLDVRKFGTARHQIDSGQGAFGLTGANYYSEVQVA